MSAEPRVWIAAFALLAMAPANLFAQACPKLGLNTVEAAEEAFFAQRPNDARTLLERAYGQCRNDPRVLNRIGEVFKMIGDKKKSEDFVRIAAELGGKPTLKIDTVTSLDEPEIQLPSYVKRKHALIVGVSHFKDFTALNAKMEPTAPRYAKINSLEYAAKDAADFAQVLEDPGYGRFQAARVTRLLNADATIANFRREISRLEREVEEEDLVVLFISSHGSSPEMDPAAKDAQSGFILMQDTEVRATLDTATAYPMYEFTNMISRLKARRVVAFLDTCYSGDSLRGGGKSLSGARGDKGVMVGLGDLDPLIKATPQDKARVIITSSNNSERSWESEKIQNGYFTEYLIEALKLDQGQKSITEIYKHIEERVPAAVETDKGGAQQHPQMRSYPASRREIRIRLGIPETEGGPTK
jgi:hypothetical protein